MVMHRRSYIHFVVACFHNRKWYSLPRVAPVGGSGGTNPSHRCSSQITSLCHATDKAAPPAQPRRSARMVVTGRSTLSYPPPSSSLLFAAIYGGALRPWVLPDGHCRSPRVLRVLFGGVSPSSTIGWRQSLCRWPIPATSDGVPCRGAALRRRC
jgi:hypothetical protein